MRNLVVIKFLLLFFIVLNTACSTKKPGKVIASEVKKSSKVNSTNPKSGETKKSGEAQTAGEKPEEAIDATIPTEISFAFDFEKSVLLSDVLETAKLQNKPVFLDLNAKWCTACKLMQRDVYNNDETASFFNSNFVNYMVDVESGEGPDLKLIYDINILPTLLWLDSKGRVLLKKEGACYNSELMKQAQNALKNAIK